MLHSSARNDGEYIERVNRILCCAEAGHGHGYELSFLQLSDYTSKPESCKVMCIFNRSWQEKEVVFIAALVTPWGVRTDG